MFNIEKFIQIQQPSNRYEKRLEALRQEGWKTEYIQKAVKDALDNLRAGINSFIIYGVPLLVALTANIHNDLTN